METGKPKAMLARYSRKEFLAAAGGTLAATVSPLQAGKLDDRIKAAMLEQIAKNEVPGAVTVVVTPKGVKHLAAVGHANAAKTQLLRKDSIFWIASMTKPVVAVSILMLQDQGKLAIDDLVSKYIPEFLGSPITLRHMLTHTSGLPEGTPAELAKAETLADVVPIYAGKPVQFQPGQQWKYCQSGINLLGRVIEVVSKHDLETFFRLRLFDPLGMEDTSFYLTESQMPRLVTTAKWEEGKLSDGVNPILYGKAPTDRKRFPAANGGLYSTGPDYARFARMLLQGGELDGRVYLTSKALQQMTANQTGSLKAGFIPGHYWGLGVGVVAEPQGQTALLKPGTFGHGGAHGTQAWIDPKTGVALVMMVQRANFKNSDDSPVRQAFTTAALEGWKG